MRSFVSAGGRSRRPAGEMKVLRLGTNDAANELRSREDSSTASETLDVQRPHKIEKNWRLTLIEGARPSHTR